MTTSMDVSMDLRVARAGGHGIISRYILFH